MVCIKQNKYGKLDCWEKEYDEKYGCFVCTHECVNHLKVLLDHTDRLREDYENILHRCREDLETILKLLEDGRITGNFDIEAAIKVAKQGLRR